jgi:uncharacterized protein YjbI with pentapeptide repeats
MDMGASLVERWIGRKDVLPRTGALGSSPFGQLDGLEDYRGADYAFKGIIYSGEWDLEGLIASSVDFTGAEFCYLNIRRSHFKDCVFKGADMRVVVDRGNLFEDCVFERTDFRKALLGLEGSRYRGCTFENCMFAGIGFARAEFDNCFFKARKFSMTDFEASSFVSCKFSGLLKSVWFRGDYTFPEHRERYGVPRPNTMADVSFEEAELVDVMFTDGVPLDTVKLPSKGEYLLVKGWRDALARIRQMATVQGPMQEGLVFFAKIYGRRENDPQDQRILNFDDVVDTVGVDLARIVWEELGGSAPREKNE